MEEKTARTRKKRPITVECWTKESAHWLPFEPAAEFTTDADAAKWIKGNYEEGLHYRIIATIWEGVPTVKTRTTVKL